jgi:hypothetical protein
MFEYGGQIKRRGCGYGGGGGSGGGGGVPGVNGKDGREIEIRNDGTAIQIRYVGDTDWNDLVLLEDLRGADGADGKDGKDGEADANGANGKDGREIEIQNDGTAIQIRYVGDTDWNDLVLLEALRGPAGPEGVGLKVLGIVACSADILSTGEPGDAYLVGTSEAPYNLYVWDELSDSFVDTGTIAAGPQGPQGEKGEPGADGKDGKDGTDMEFELAQTLDGDENDKAPSVAAVHAVLGDISAALDAINGETVP